MAAAGQNGVDTVTGDYASELVAGLAEAPGRHANALQHAAGGGRIGDAERGALHTAIDRATAGDVALADPLDLLHHLARPCGNDWLAQRAIWTSVPLSTLGRAEPPFGRCGQSC